MPSRAFEPRLLTAARAGRAYLGMTLVLAVGVTVLVLMQATLIASVIARATAGASYAALRATLLALLAVVAARGALVYGSEVTALRAAATIKSGLRRKVVAQALARGPAWLSGQRVGELTTLTTRGLDALDPYFARYLPQVFLAVLLPLMVVSRVAWADWPSAVVIAVTLPLIPLFMVLVGARARDRTERQWRLLARLGGHFLDVVGGLPTLQVFNRARAQVDVIRDVSDAHRRHSMAALRIAFLSALVLELLATLAMALVAVEVGVRLLQGHLRYQTALLVLLLTPEAYLPLRQLGAHWHASMEGVAAARQALDVTDLLTEGGAGGRATVDARRDAIVFDNVTVQFDARSAPALSKVSFELLPGEHVCLVGPSGAGKSTVLALALGLLQPTGGEVRVGGSLLTDIDLDAWRGQLAWLPQRPHLFATSIADNIALGSPQADRSAVRTAAVSAGADDFIRALPSGYDTQLSENGLTLSAGQRQRIAIARALLRDVPVVLLDEPTAHLDPDSARALRSAVAAFMTGRTVVWVSHDPAVPDGFDRVLRLAPADAVSAA